MCIRSLWFDIFEPSCGYIKLVCHFIPKNFQLLNNHDLVLIVSQDEFIELFLGIWNPPSKVNFLNVKYFFHLFIRFKSFILLVTEIKLISNILQRDWVISHTVHKLQLFLCFLSPITASPEIYHLSFKLRLSRDSWYYRPSCLFSHVKYLEILIPKGLLFIRSQNSKRDPLVM